MTPVKKKVKPRSLKINPTDNIGPPWQWIGTLIVLAVIGLFVYEVLKGDHIDREFVIMAGIGVCAGFGMIRPSFLDNLVKTLADKLPGFSFHKKEDPGAD